MPPPFQNFGYRPGSLMPSPWAHFGAGLATSFGSTMQSSIERNRAMEAERAKLEAAQAEKARLAAERIQARFQLEGAKMQNSRDITEYREKGANTRHQGLLDEKRAGRELGQDTAMLNDLEDPLKKLDAATLGYFQEKLLPYKTQPPSTERTAAIQKIYAEMVEAAKKANADALSLAHRRKLNERAAGRNARPPTIRVPQTVQRWLKELQTSGPTDFMNRQFTESAADASVRRGAAAPLVQNLAQRIERAITSGDQRSPAEMVTGDDLSAIAAAINHETGQRLGPNEVLTLLRIPGTGPGADRSGF